MASENVFNSKARLKCWDWLSKYNHINGKDKTNSKEINCPESSPQATRGSKSGQKECPYLFRT